MELNEEWLVLSKFFPKDWRHKAKQLGALQRQRKIKSADDLLRLLLIHLADGCSMRETVSRAQQGGLSFISDVALLKRLRSSSEWFRWMSTELLKRRGLSMVCPDWLERYDVRSVDASIINEPGSTGADWRLHYSIKLFGLKCDQFLISRPKVGESFLNFHVNRGDLLIGDRAYGRVKGMQYVKNKNGDYLVRLKSKAFSMHDKCGGQFELLPKLRTLPYEEVGEWLIQAGSEHSGGKLAVRICAIKKSKEAAEEAIKKTLAEQKKKQRTVNPETLEMHRYIVLATSLPDDITGEQVMELYRNRWQIEIAFKRLKSIIGLGHLPKVDEESARSWLHGKLFVALVAQAIVDEGRFFSPWGYPI